MRHLVVQEAPSVGHIQAEQVAPSGGQIYNWIGSLLNAPLLWAVLIFCWLSRWVWQKWNMIQFVVFFKFCTFSTFNIIIFIFISSVSKQDRKTLLWLFSPRIIIQPTKDSAYLKLVQNGKYRARWLAADKTIRTSKAQKMRLLCTDVEPSLGHWRRWQRIWI